MVDAHTHLLPDRLTAAIRRFFEQDGPVPFAYPADPPAVLQRHVADGIDTVWTLPYAHTAGLAARLNADVARLARAWSTPAVTVVPGCTVHPADDDPVRDLTDAVAAGSRVAKLHCSVGRYDLDDGRLQPVLRAAGRLGVPVVVHVGHDASGRTGPGELAAVGRAAQRHPDTILVIAHTAHPATAAAVELLRRHPNLRADLTPVVTELVALDPTTLEERHHQLLLGTDAPNTCVSGLDVLNWLAAAGLSDHAHRAITGGNARALLEVDSPDTCCNGD